MRTEFFSDLQDQISGWSGCHPLHSESYNARTFGSGKSQDSMKIRIERHYDTILLRGMLQDQFISSFGHADFRDMDGILAGRS